MITLERMSRNELPLAWQSMRREFPDDERKPLSMIQAQYDRGVYDTWWLKKNGERKGYALLLRAEGCPYVLLDYLAMLEKGGGYGSVCLERLKERYPQGILVEAEAVTEGLTPEVRDLRQRRLRFYQRAGFVPCPFQNRVFGVVYLVHLWARELPPDRDALCARAYHQLYQSQLPQAWLDAHFYVEGQGGKQEGTL